MFRILLAVAIALVLVQSMDCYGSDLTVDAFQVIQAEDFDYSHTNDIENCPSSSVYYVGSINPGAYFGYYGVDFGSGAEMIELRIASWDHGIIHLHLDSDSNEPFVSIPIQMVNPWQSVCNFFNLQQFVSTVPTGVHDLHFTFEWPDGVPHFVNIDWFTFKSTS